MSAAPLSAQQVALADAMVAAIGAINAQGFACLWRREGAVEVLMIARGPFAVPAGRAKARPEALAVTCDALGEHAHAAAVREAAARCEATTA